MKKIIYTSLFALSIAVSCGASAGFEPNAPASQGGFKGPTDGITTVAAALNAKDDTLVQLTGHIEKETAKEKYQFRDSTGAIIIEIDNDDWNGLTVTPADTVTIYGEVDKEIMHSPEIDVDRIEKK
ncbi:MAG: YgiW/YdeI family stress tolerance OB fold protein [Alphaproteobacteria bacterium]|nr:YgiW/YdeI family stress tolerance OB fold protein [Alphaproteobacteria bacterium]